MVTTVKVIEYNEEGIAIIEDTAGKYVVSRGSSDMIHVPNSEKELEKYFGKRIPCALLKPNVHTQSRSAMMT